MSEPAAEKAIQKLLIEYQKLADAEKAQGPRREAAKQKLDQLVDDLAGLGTFDETKISNEMLAAFALADQMAVQKIQRGDPSGQMFYTKFDDSFLQELDKTMKKLSVDPVRAQRVQQAARSLSMDLQPPRVLPGQITFQVAVDEPKNDFGAWTLAVVPVTVDENFKVKLVDKLDFDIYLSAHVTPFESLSGAFNAPAKAFKAGEKVEPLVIRHETKENGPQTIVHIQGHIHKDGAYRQSLPFAPLALQKADPNQMDMEAFLKMMKGGPGSHKLH